MRQLLSFLTIAVLLLATISCAGRDNAVSPVIPEPEMTLGASSHTGQSQTHLWGYYDIYIDIESQTVEAVENRQAMFTCNVVNFLNSKPAGLGFKINSTPIGPDYVDVDIDVSITHPFPGMPQYNGYDVRGVFMGDGSANLEYNSDLIYSVLGTDQLMLADPTDGFGGPDGYTRWFNKPEFSTGGMLLFQYTQGKVATPGFNGNATLNAYKYFADGLGTNEDLWTWLNAHADQHGQFSSGTTNTRNYYLRFPNAKGVKYGYAIIANWEGVEPQYHPSNAPEAVACKVTDNSTVYYVDPTSKGGNLILDINLWDWNSEITGGVMEDYRIYIESTVLSAVHQFTTSEMTPTGGGEHFSTYHVEIPADNITGTEGQEYWVIAECADEDYTNDFGVPNLADTDPLAAFFRNDLTISGEVPVDFGWARTWGGINNDYGIAIAVSPDGNIYVTGDFEGTVDFDPGDGVEERTANGVWDAFLVKFNSFGDFQWVRTWGGTGWPGNSGYGAAVSSDGSVYVAGPFSGTCNFGGEEYTSQGTDDIYVAKFDSLGNLQWARTWGGTSTDQAKDVNVTPQGDVYISGYFAGTVDFDPGPSIDNHTATNPGVDVFLSKFNSSGNYQWARTWGGADTDDGLSVAADSGENAYVTGYFSSTTDFDPGLGVDEHTPNGSYDIFLSKFTSSGNFSWVRTWGGTALDGGMGVIVYQSDDSVYVTGQFQDTVDFNPWGSGDFHTSNGDRDVFLSKFDSSGNFVWARHWGGTGMENTWGGRTVNVSPDGEPYVTGYFNSTNADFDPGLGVDQHSTNGGTDVFLSKFDPAGDFLWARTWGGADADYGSGVAVSPDGYVYVTGDFKGTVDFDPSSGVDNHTSNGNADVFLSKFLPDGSW